MSPLLNSPWSFNWDNSSMAKQSRSGPKTQMETVGKVSCEGCKSPSGWRMHNLFFSSYSLNHDPGFSTTWSTLAAGHSCWGETVKISQLLWYLRGCHAWLQRGRLVAGTCHSSLGAFAHLYAGTESHLLSLCLLFSLLLLLQQSTPDWKMRGGKGM